MLTKADEQRITDTAVFKKDGEVGKRGVMTDTADSPATAGLVTAARTGDHAAFADLIQRVSIRFTRAADSAMLAPLQLM
jgi:hypothetical protein